jgi:DNA-binding transcriptional ArsR family regulator
MPSDDDDWVPVDGVPPQADRLDLDDLDLMAETTHPIRSTIIRRLKEPRTVAQVAELLDVPITRLYHHVNRLVDAGLVRVVATRQVAAVTERRYQTVARSFGISKEMLASTDPRELSAALGALFDLAKVDFQRFVEREGITVDDDQDTALALSSVHLTDARRRELMQRLDELITEFKSDAADDDPSATQINLFIAASPKPK